MEKSYAILKLSGVPSSVYDDVCYRLFEDGAEGVSESLQFIQESQQYDPQIIPTETKNIEAFFVPEKTNWEKMKLDYAPFSPSLQYEENKDWMAEWKKHYEPFCVTGDLWIYPSWVEVNEINRKVIKIDPGLAFGTGTHATTLLCMKKIEELFNKTSLNSVLDMGAGTGILSLLCHLNGFKNIVAVEIDEMARDKCRENFELNEFEGGQVLPPQDGLFETQYDLVVANIIDGVLLRIQNQLKKATAKHLILSGILRENEERVKKEFLSDSDFELLATEYQEEWCLFHFKKSF